MYYQSHNADDFILLEVPPLIAKIFGEGDLLFIIIYFCACQKFATNFNIFRVAQGHTMIKCQSWANFSQKHNMDTYPIWCTFFSPKNIYLQAKSACKKAKWGQATKTNPSTVAFVWVSLKLSTTLGETMKLWKIRNMRWKIKPALKFTYFRNKCLHERVLFDKAGCVLFNYLLLTQCTFTLTHYSHSQIELSILSNSIQQGIYIHHRRIE